MEIEMSTESHTMFARRPKRWLRKVRHQAIEAAMEEKGMTRGEAERACSQVTDEQILGFTFQAGITAAQIEDDGSWWDWLRDKFANIDWIKVLQVVASVLSIMVLFLGKEPKAHPESLANKDYE